MIAQPAIERFCALLLFFSFFDGSLATAQDRAQRYVHLAPDGKLSYSTDSAGNRIPDYSYCGFRSGNMPIPEIQARVLVDPVPGDATDAIQRAIDYIAELPADAHGFRGAVLLAPGIFQVAGQLQVRSSGIVLRGDSSAQGSTIRATGLDRRTLIRIAGAGQPRLGKEIPIADKYVAAGASKLTLAETVPRSESESWKSGAEILITHPSSIEWIGSIGMNRFPTDDKGSWLDWKPGTMDVRWERSVEQIDGNQIAFGVPLTCSIDANLTKGTVRRIDWPERIHNIGIESLTLVSVSTSQNPKDEEHAWNAIDIEKACDIWVRDVSTKGFSGSTVSILENAKRVSVIQCSSSAPISEHAAGRRRTFYTCGQQTLFQSCKADSGRHDFAVGYLAAGPNAFVDCSATNAQSFSGPIESWATGVLYDNVSIDGGGLALTNREIDGQGIGWTTANSLLWQCSAPIITCRNPPDHHNWAIGCWAGFVGDGHWKSMNEFVKPDSLYQAQHSERLTLELSPTILSAKPVSKSRNEITPEDQHGFRKALARTRPPQKRESSIALSVQNGWLCVGGKIATGSRSGTTWWRGSMLPSRVSDFGVGVTRFTPGRAGRGFTDDLDELTDSMVENNQMILEHHWGLWYDRRRDDHEMIRRLDAEVWAPFYEQPWARSGQGIAWDGLSKYDLDSFNPWYFSRLREFAEQCESKGRILMQQMYFQHNILEAGAHWADFPWRSANNLQQVGFVEPPPYANKKRIFQADEFYDVSHPVRRALHVAYIRHCLSNMIDRNNVVFSIAEEFTGPESFVRFWLETIAEWKKENPKWTPLICLGCTKDVQDNVLSDPELCALIQIVDLKYWWYFADGALYAPAGGQNLAPRQQLREWKGKTSRSDLQTARQIHEMRVRFPDKAILTNFPTQNSWSTLAAGGSVPARSLGLPADLLVAIPKMTPIKGMSGNRFGVMKESDLYLLFGMQESELSSIKLPLASFNKEFLGQWLDPNSGVALREVNVSKGADFEETPPVGPSYLLWLKTR